MSELRVIYRTLKNAIPPRPIRLERPGWAGDPKQKRVDGAVAQPWHCVPFVEAATYGLELIYSHASECVVTGDKDGRASFQFDWEGEEGLKGDEFSAFAPGHYGFATGLDIQCPPGHVLRIEPHPRFFADTTGTVPLAAIGNIQTEWWPMFFFAVFKAPSPGARHVFRKGEPYAQVCIVPHKPSIVLEPMSGPERETRSQLHLSLVLFAGYATRNRWQASHGNTFDDRYRVLAHAYNEGGYTAVMKTLNDAGAAHGVLLGEDVSTDDAIRTALEHHNAGRLPVAEAVYRQILSRDPNHADALHLLGVIVHQAGDSATGAAMIRRAISIAPDVPTYPNNLSVCLRAIGKADDAERVLRDALARHPGVASLWVNLGDLLLSNGRGDEAIMAWRRVVELIPTDPGARARFGVVLQELGRTDEARRELSRALEFQPDFAEARQLLDSLNLTEERS